LPRLTGVAVALTALLLLPQGVSATSTVRKPAKRPSRVILVRHAEKEHGMGRDPPLTQRGSERAEALMQALEGVPIDVVFVTQFRRTLETAEPLVKERGLEPASLPAGRWRALVRELKTRHPNQTILVVGHSFTLPQIVRHLGVRSSVREVKRRYGDLLTVTYDPNGRPTLQQRHFGE